MTALLPVSEEVRKRCRLKFRIPGTLVGTGEQESQCPTSQPNTPSNTTTATTNTYTNTGSSTTNISSTTIHTTKHQSSFPSTIYSSNIDWVGSDESLIDSSSQQTNNQRGHNSSLSLIKALLPNPLIQSNLSQRNNRSRPELNTGNFSPANNLIPSGDFTHQLLLRPTLERQGIGITQETNQAHLTYQQLSKRQQGILCTTDSLRSRSIDECISGNVIATNTERYGTANSSQHNKDETVDNQVVVNGSEFDESGNQINQREQQLLPRNMPSEQKPPTGTTLVRYTTDENESRVLYEFLADASMVFPRVFPVIHSLLDSKINYVLTHCHDQKILSAVQSIIQNMISSGETSVQQLHYLQSKIIYLLYILLIDSHLPGEDLRTSYTPVIGLSNTGRAGNLSSDSSLSLSSVHGPMNEMSTANVAAGATVSHTTTTASNNNSNSSNVDPLTNGNDKDGPVSISPITLVNVPCGLVNNDHEERRSSLSTIGPVSKDQQDLESEYFNASRRRRSGSNVSGFEHIMQVCFRFVCFLGGFLVFETILPRHCWCIHSIP
ncbi:unnamed protein product [Trichobilharzia regenti]|nr:unnamed protein product [Trichobilharzia regenti]